MDLRLPNPQASKLRVLIIHEGDTQQIAMQNSSSHSESALRSALDLGRCPCSEEDIHWCWLAYCPRGENPDLSAIAAIRTGYCQNAVSLHDEFGTVISYNCAHGGAGRHNRRSLEVRLVHGHDQAWLIRVSIHGIKGWEVVLRVS